MKKTSQRRREARIRRRKPKPSRPLLTYKVFTTARLSEGEDTNADSVAFDSDTKYLAISDGVSRSFRPREWARYLVEEIVTTTTDIRELDIAEICRRFPSVSTVDLPWTQHALLDRYGSQATVMVLKFSPQSDGVVQVSHFSIGDCFLIYERMDDHTTHLIGWPFSAPADFPKVPSVVCSHEPHIRGAGFDPSEFLLERGGRVFVMTDALGRYASGRLNDGYHLDQVFPFLDGSIDFQSWAGTLTSDGVLEEDDLTIAVVGTK